jgi:hypothetical protein
MSLSHDAAVVFHHQVYEPNDLAVDETGDIYISDTAPLDWTQGKIVSNSRMGRSRSGSKATTPGVPTECILMMVIPTFTAKTVVAYRFKA